MVVSAEEVDIWAVRKISVAVVLCNMYQALQDMQRMLE
jgi:hypothetical protein